MGGPNSCSDHPRIATNHNHNHNHNRNFDSDSDSGRIHNCDGLCS